MDSPIMVSPLKGLSVYILLSVTSLLIAASCLSSPPTQIGLTITPRTHTEKEVVEVLSDWLANTAISESWGIIPFHLSASRLLWQVSYNPDTAIWNIGITLYIYTDPHNTARKQISNNPILDDRDLVMGRVQERVNLEWIVDDSSLAVSLVNDPKGFFQLASSETSDPLEILNNNLLTYQSAAMWTPPPKSMKELVSKSDVIVIGTIKSVVDEGTMGSYNEADNARNNKPDDPVSSALPITDFEIEVERVILDDGSISSGQPLVLRIIGEADVEQRFPTILRMPQVGDYRLFTLSKNPDGKTYGLYGWWSDFVIDGDKVTYADDLRTPIGFTDQVKLAGFILELEAVVAQK